MTQLSDKEHNVQMEDMKSFDEQMPCVGIFWYDPEDNTLFGVRKKELTPQMVEEAAEKGKPFINYPQLHRQVWAKEYFRAQAKHLDTKFKGDYTQVPRGRVAWTIDKSSCTTSIGTLVTAGQETCNHGSAGKREFQKYSNGFRTIHRPVP